MVNSTSLRLAKPVLNASFRVAIIDPNHEARGWRLAWMAIRPRCNVTQGDFKS